MKMKKRLIAILLLPLMFVCIASVDAASKVEKDLEELKRRLETIEQATIGKGSNRVSALEERQSATVSLQAEQQAALDELRVEFQKLQGAFDELEYSRKELHDLINMMRSEMELKFGAIEERLAKLENRPAIVAPVSKPDVNPAAEYEAALKLIQKDGEFGHGRKGLQAFLEKYPEHELAVNATYWVGEAYYGDKEFEKAILQFQEVLKKYPQHNKAASSQLKQALAFQSLGDNDTATVLLKKVVKNYPESPEAKKAQERLEKK
jgi:tol-pal system protein YbgF